MDSGSYGKSHQREINGQSKRDRGRKGRKGRKERHKDRHIETDRQRDSYFEELANMRAGKSKICNCLTNAYHGLVRLTHKMNNHTATQDN